jgi:hypothetical protein
VFLEPGNTLRLEQSARIVDNIARKKGGGVYASSSGGSRARIIVKPNAAIVNNRPENIFRESS